MPFAVVGSNATIEVQGKKVRGRRYPWGVVEGWCLQWPSVERESLRGLTGLTFIFSLGWLKRR